jgi:hypothetical protein
MKFEKIAAPKGVREYPLYSIAASVNQLML